MKMKEGSFYRLTMTDEVSCEIIDRWDERADCIAESHDETFAVGREIDVCVLDDNGEYINLQFDDGSVIYGFLKKFTAKEI